MLSVWSHQSTWQSPNFTNQIPLRRWNRKRHTNQECHLVVKTSLYGLLGAIKNHTLCRLSYHSQKLADKLIAQLISKTSSRDHILEHIFKQTRGLVHRILDFISGQKGWILNTEELTERTFAGSLYDSRVYLNFKPLTSEFRERYCFSSDKCNFCPPRCL